ncbi:MAG: hypothetical protein ACOH15_10760 [Acetobacterium sp.]
MELFLNILKGFLLLFSCLGYMYFAKKRLNVTSEIIPLFTLSSIALLVYFGGLAGKLLPTVYLIFVIGIGFFIYALADMRKIHVLSQLISKLSLFKIVFFIGSFIFIIFIIGVKFQHYDNFSHWGIVVKEMLCTNAFPTAESALIDYKDYPLGISSLIYYVCCIINNSQGIMLAAQALIIFSSFYGMFIIIKEKKRFLLYAFLSAGFSVLSVFNITIRINNLLVDFILPLLSLVALAVIYRYKDKVLKAAILLIPILGLLVIIKTTGIIFASIPLIYFFYQVLRKKENRDIKSFSILIFTVIFSMIPAILWKIHMALVFSGLNSKFNLTAETVKSGIDGKTSAEISQITQLFIQSVLDITTRPVIGFVVFNLLAVAFYIVARKLFDKRYELLKALIALNIVVILYSLGILGLYIFSMPADEALRLAGFERYASSIIVLFSGGLLLCATIDIENTFAFKIGNTTDYRSFKSIESKKYYQLAIIVSLAIALPFLISEYNGLVYNKNQYSDSFPAHMYSVVGDNWPEGGTVDENRYLIYATDKDGQMTDYYVQYVARYFLYGKNIDAVCSLYEDNLINLLNNYDYLVVVEADYSERKLLKKYFNIQGDPGVFKISELFEHQNTN